MLRLKVSILFFLRISKYSLAGLEDVAVKLSLTFDQAFFPLDSARKKRPPDCNNNNNNNIFYLNTVGFKANIAYGSV